MVSEADKNNIKRVLGHRYAPKIQKYLIEKEITNSRGNTPSITMIHQIVGGYKEDYNIESAIVELVEIEKKKRRKLQQKKEALSKD